VVIAEGVSGTFYYHLAAAENTAQALCGAQTMPTLLDLDAWGKTGHLNERWCKRCEVEQVQRQPAAGK
jgi:hypothetical protein